MSRPEDRSESRNRGTPRDGTVAGAGTGAVAVAGSVSAPEPVVRDPRLAAVWAAIPDPVRDERPGEGAARVARVLAVYQRELAGRDRFGTLAPVPLRWAAALALVVGLVLGLAVSSHLALGGTVPVAQPRFADAPPRPTDAPPRPTDAPPRPMDAPPRPEEVPPSEASWVQADVSDLSPPLLAELYLEDLGLGPDTGGAEGLSDETADEEQLR
jgi:hypothetical protein